MRIRKLLTKEWHFSYIHWSFYFDKFYGFKLKPCTHAPLKQRADVVKQTVFLRSINPQNHLNCFFLVLVSLMITSTGLSFNLIDELNTNYAKFIRTFPPKLHYAARIRNIRRNGAWSGPAILYFSKNGNRKRLFVKFVWSIIKQY